VVYASWVGRATIFSLVFLILLPFFVSIPAMIYMRVSHGLLHDTLGLVIIGLAFALLMFLLLAEVLFSIRNRIELGDQAVKLTVPAGGGPTPLFRYVNHEVPFDRIKAVETRREVYGGSLAPVLMRGARIITTDDKPIRLGYVNERNEDPAFPYLTIAEQIAKRAGVTVIDRGNVRRSVMNKAMGVVSRGGDSIEERDIEHLNTRHARVMVALVAGLVVLLGIGVVSDLTSESPTPIPVSEPAPKPKSK
jgi:hypothetical protein